MQINLSLLDKLIAILVCNIKLHPRKDYDDTILNGNGKSIFDFLKRQLINVQSLEIPDQNPESINNAYTRALLTIEKSNDTSILYDCISEIESKITDLAFVDEFYKRMYCDLIAFGFNDFIYGIVPWKVKIKEEGEFDKNDVIAVLSEYTETTLPNFECFIEKYQFGFTELIDENIDHDVVVNSIQEINDNLQRVWKKIVYRYSPNFRNFVISNSINTIIDVVMYADYKSIEKSEIIQSWSDNKYIDDCMTEEDVVLAISTFGFLETRDPNLTLLEQLYNEGKKRFYQEPIHIVNLPMNEIKTEEDVLALYENPEITIWELREELKKICHKKSKLDIRRVLYLYLTRHYSTFIKFENVYCLSKKECIGVLVHYWLMKR